MLTEKMIQAMRNAKADGAVIAGVSCDRRGRVLRTAAATIKALGARGYMTVSTSPDGGVMGRLTESGTNTLTLADSGNGLLASIARR